jgi:hypothetical protein
MDETGENKKIHIFSSTINDVSIKEFFERFNRSKKILVGIGTVCMILFLSGLAIIPSIVMVVNGFLLGAIISGLIGFIILGIVINKFVKSKIDPMEESKNYYIEMYSDYLILISRIKKPLKIEYSQIQRIKKYDRKLKSFSNNDIDAFFEQESYPYIHIATDNNNLFSIEIKNRNSNTNKSFNEYILDIDDIEIFKKIIEA